MDFRLFCDEFWFQIAVYLPSLKSFALFWSSIPYLHRSTLTQDSDYWSTICEHFCSTRGKDYAKLWSRLTFHQSGISIVRALYQPKRCNRSGCSKLFTEWDNGPTLCSFHPGKLRSTGLLTCCRGKGFISVGCKVSLHDGTVHNMIHLSRLGLNENSQCKQGKAISIFPPIKCSVSVHKSNPPRVISPEERLPCILGAPVP